MKKEVPNYTMLRLMLIESDRIKTRFPEIEQMPDGYICPGYDIRLMPTLAVLKYLCKVKTQWSCQGTHKGDETRKAYILLASGETFPSNLVTILTDSGFIIQTVGDCDEKGNDNGKTRLMASSSSQKEINEAELEILNETFLNIIDNWAKSKIIEHIPQMNDPYYADVVSMYG